MRNLVIIANDMRSAHNVGSLLRTAEGLGVSKVYLTGITPYPATDNDPRLPHISRKLDEQINKTALNASRQVTWVYTEEVSDAIKELRDSGYVIAALEQTSDSIPLHKYKASEKVAIVLGTETTGLTPEVLKLCDISLEIPMFGKKESFNVVQAAAMALHWLRFT